MDSYIKLAVAVLILVSCRTMTPPFAAAFPGMPPFPGPAPSINPWAPFMNLSGCFPGENNPVLPDLKKYFQQFGYLPPDPANFTDAFDDALQAAIRAYQQNFKLPETGLLDPSTLSQISAPRCGVADIVNGTSTMSSHTHGRNLYTYFPGSPMWPSDRRELTYAFSSTSSVSIDISTLRAVFQRAFSRWANATTITFTETDSVAGADIRLGFYSGNHDDGEPFDGVLGTLAHAFSPTDGRFHLDAAEHWVAAGDVANADSDSAVDLESVAVHEIGHLLGLGHSAEAEAIMYPTIRTKTRKVELASDDVQGIQSLYGGNPGYKAPATTVPARDTSRSAAVGGRVVGTGTRSLQIGLTAVLWWLML